MPLLTCLHQREVPAWLKDHHPGSPFPALKSLLQGSVFYPASWMDGRPVKYLGGCYHSFIYADWKVPEERLERQIDTFKGYRLLDLRKISAGDIFSSTSEAGSDFYSRRTLEPSQTRINFIFWCVYQRQADFGPTHGPERFSLLFIGGEGVTTFQKLYVHNGCRPDVLALIKCDAFTGNWTQFFRPDRELARVVMRNSAGVPTFLFCDYIIDTSPWPWYPALIQKIVSQKNDNGTHQRLHLWGRSPSACFMPTT